MSPTVSATAMSASVQSGETSAVDIVDAALERVAALDLNAFLSVRAEAARTDAAEVDRRVAEGQALALAGVPVALKDNIALKDGPTTCGSRLLEPYISPYDATAVARLKAAGAVVVGKTNLDEFAMGSSTENSAYGPTRNPHDRDRVAGGSSGGSAAAVAVGAVPIALGSSTGGSVRQPAAFCGVVGVKPTYGRVSRFGLVAFGSSFDQIGTLATSVEDAALLLEVVAGSDPSDATTRPEPVGELATGIDSWEPRAARIGWPKEYFATGLDPEIRRACETALERLAAGGAEIVEVSLPHSERGVAVYYIVAIAEASSNLARYDGVRYGFRAPAACSRCTSAPGPRLAPRSSAASCSALMCCRPVTTRRFMARERRYARGSRPISMLRGNRSMRSWHPRHPRRRLGSARRSTIHSRCT